MSGTNEQQGVNNTPTVTHGMSGTNEQQGVNNTPHRDPRNERDK